MKYVWLREMPYAKIGDEVKIAKCSDRDSGWNIHNNVLYVSDNYFTDLIIAGWIKEVKPREFTLVIGRENGCIYGAAVPHSTTNDRLETIKVREVLG